MVSVWMKYSAPAGSDELEAVGAETAAARHRDRVAVSRDRAAVDPGHPEEGRPRQRRARLVLGGSRDAGEDRRAIAVGLAAGEPALELHANGAGGGDAPVVVFEPRPGDRDVGAVALPVRHPLAAGIGAAGVGHHLRANRARGDRLRPAGPGPDRLERHEGPTVPAGASLAHVDLVEGAEGPPVAAGPADAHRPLVERRQRPAVAADAAEPLADVVQRRQVAPVAAAAAHSGGDGVEDVDVEADGRHGVWSLGCGAGRRLRGGSTGRRARYLVRAFSDWG